MTDTSQSASAIRPYEEALPIALLRTREAVMTRFRPHLAENGLTEQQWRVIRAVQQAGNIDPTALADRCCILLPSLSRMLKSLENDDLVARKTEKEDKRRQVITLTSKGLALFSKMVPESEKIYSEIEARFGKEKISELVMIMQQLRMVLEDEG